MDENKLIEYTFDLVISLPEGVSHEKFMEVIIAAAELVGGTVGGGAYPYQEGQDDGENGKH